MEKYLAIFNQLKSERAAEFQTQHGLSIKTGEGLGAAILKVMRPSWTTDSPGELLNTNGLFFSIWIDAACEEKNIVRYNLHAKKLRYIKNKTFAARDFARKVRADAKTELATWPAACAEIADTLREVPDDVAEYKSFGRNSTAVISWLDAAAGRVTG